MQKSSTRFASLNRFTTGALAALSIIGALAADAHAGPRRIGSVLPVVEHIDLNRYAGKWFEIVNPTWSASATCHDAVDVYTADTNDVTPVKLSAVHSCTRAGLLIHRADGTLSAPDAQAPGRLILQAKSTLGRASYTHYDIVDLDTDYQWAVVSDDTRRYIWILSRTPALTTDTLQGIMQRLQELEGYTAIEKSLSCVTQSTAKTQNCKAALGL